MSRHEGVSCDSCLKGNFRGRRYKCLVCYDYDLCASCYEAGATTTRHLTDHPMQCILTRTDFELYYGGEGVSVEQPQSLTCPYCTRMGFTEATLQEHVSADHPDTTFEVVCPVCAFVPGGDPNHVTDDFANHLTTEHRSGSRDLISFLDEPTSSRHGPRRIPHPSRGVGGSRTRRTCRSNMLFSSSGGLSPSSRDSIDPIAELLSQLSGVRRAGGSTGQSSQLQQLQMQLQLERQQVRAASRHQLERLPRRQPQAIGSVSGGSSGNASTSNANNGSHSGAMAGVVTNNSAGNNNSLAVNPSSGSSANSQNSMFLLPRCIAETLSDSQLQSIERENANKSLFVRELVMGTLAQALPDLSQQFQISAIQTPNSSTTTATTCPETPNACATVTVKKSSTSSTVQEGKRESTPLPTKPPLTGQSHQVHSTAAGSVSSLQGVAAGVQSQGVAASIQSQGVAASLQSQGVAASLQSQGVAASLQSQGVAASLQSQGLAASLQSQGVAASLQSQGMAASLQSQGVAASLQSQGLPSANPIVQTLMHSVLPQPLVLQQPLPTPVRNTGTGTIREPIGAAPAYLRGSVGPVGVTGSSRRKPVRSVDGRNQSTEPPPPH